MKSYLLLLPCFALLALLTAGCAAQDPMAELRREEIMSAAIEEMRVYIQTAKPEQVPQMRHTKPFRWEYLNDTFIVIDEGSEKYLLEFRGRCEELGSKDLQPDMTDLRQSTGSLRILRPGIDTIRGCTIKKIYRLPKEGKTNDETE